MVAQAKPKPSAYTSRIGYMVAAKNVPKSPSDEEEAVSPGKRVVVYYKDVVDVCHLFVYLPTNSFQHSSQNEIISRRPRRAHSSPPLPNGSASSQAATRWREEGRMKADGCGACMCVWWREVDSEERERGRLYRPMLLCCR